MDERKIGFMQGVIYAAALITQYQMDGISLLDEAGFKNEDLLKYGEEYDLEILGLIEKD